MPAFAGALGRFFAQHIRAACVGGSLAQLRPSTDCLMAWGARGLLRIYPSFAEQPREKYMSAWNRGRRRARSLEFESLESRLVLSASALSLSAPAPEAAVVQAPATSQDITLPASVASLNYWEFGQLTRLTAPLLSAQQIASIPNGYWFGQIPTDARAALTGAQVPSLRVASVGLNRLTSQQVSWLTAAQIQSLNYYDFQYLGPAQIRWLTAARIATIPAMANFAAVGGGVPGGALGAAGEGAERGQRCLFPC